MKLQSIWKCIRRGLGRCCTVQCFGTWWAPESKAWGSASSFRKHDVLDFWTKQLLSTVCACCLADYRCSFCCACSAETANHLSGEEVEAALGVLDTDSSGSIDFGEWVAWWVQKGQPLQVSQWHDEYQPYHILGHLFGNCKTHPMGFPMPINSHGGRSWRNG